MAEAVSRAGKVYSHISVKTNELLMAVLTALSAFTGEKAIKVKDKFQLFLPRWHPWDGRGDLSRRGRWEALRGLVGTDWAWVAGGALSWPRIRVTSRRAVPCVTPAQPLPGWKGPFTLCSLAGQ